MPIIRIQSNFEKKITFFFEKVLSLYKVEKPKERVLI